MNDLISVILPVYNRQEYLRECVSSIIGQSHQNLEIIIIDDGSTDDTPRICSELAAADPRIKLLSGTHSGVSTARNLGLHAATGTYVFFVDSDDVIHPLLLETLCAAMSEGNAVMGGTRVINVPENKWEYVPELIERSKGPGETTLLSHEETVQALFRGESPINLIGGVMMRRDLINGTRFRTDIFIGEDYLFIYENLIKGANAVFLRQRWYYCRIHRHNSSWDFTFRGFWTRFYRRMLVWQNEEALGRPENAKVEKHSAFIAYLSCIEQNKMSREDLKKTCGVMKQYQKILLPALNFPRKVRFFMTVYAPITHRVYCKVLSWLRKIKK